MTREQRVGEFRRLLTQRVLVLDGAMGTMIQGYKPDEAACSYSIATPARSAPNA